MLLLMMGSLKSLVRCTLLGEHESFGNYLNPEAKLKSIEESMANYLVDYVDAHFISNISPSPVLCQNICNHVIKILLVSSLMFKSVEGAGLIKVVIDAFYPLLKQQFDLAV